MKETKPGCARPEVKVDEAPEQEQSMEMNPVPKEEPAMIRVGQPAPNFTAAAFHEGKFGEVTLADYLGQWVYICFYPGDFTFV